MDDEKMAMAVDPAAQPRASSSSASAAAAASVAAVVQSRRFGVELTPGETTIVSWKKLLRDAGKVNGAATDAVAPTGAHPALESRIAPATAADQPLECEMKDGQPPANRFSAVIEKIERLYMGKESSDDEEFKDVPDDDQYDTDDSFIDDAELNDYFQVDKSATKYNGFFVNRGKLERLERSSSPNVAPKKRRRKESTKLPSEQGGGHVLSSEHVNIGNVRMKAAARSAPLVKKPSTSFPTQYGEPQQDGKLLKNKSSIPSAIDKKKTDSSINVNVSSSSKTQYKDFTLALPVDSRDFEKQKDGISQLRDVANKSKGTGESPNLTNETHRDKGVSSQVDLQLRKPSKEEYDTDTSRKIRYRDNNGIVELPDLNSPGTGSTYPMQTGRELKRVKEGAVVRPKGTTLERAIRDLEKIVAESRPAKSDVQEADAVQGVKKRLPAEVKQKLAKVARLADSQGKITSEQFRDRLMGILGHLVQEKTLKRHLKEMVEMGLSVKQAKADKFQLIKKEVTEMIRTRVTSSKSKVAEQHTGSSDDFQEPPGERFLKARCSMDDVLEDKICDLYDLYVEGMDEDRGPQARKLYVELAELWPAGYMDNLGIKDAVYRAKERKRALYKQKYKIQDDDRLKRKKLASSARVEENVRLSSQFRAGQDRSTIDSAGQVSGSSQRIISNQVTSSSGRMADPGLSSNGQDDHHVSKHQEKVRSSTGSIASDEASKALIAMRKKMKRKPEADLGAMHGSSTKSPSHHGDLKDKSQKRVPDNSDSTPQTTIYSLGLPCPKQPN